MPSNGKPSTELVQQFSPMTVREQENVSKWRMGQIERLTDEQLANIGSLLVTGRREDLEQVRDDPDASFLQIWLAGLMIQSLNTGDEKMFDKLMNRIVGKPKERIEISQGQKTIEVESTAEMRSRLKRLRAEAAEIDDDPL